MRVDLGSEVDDSGRTLVVTALVKHRSSRTRRSARFVVDTGSPVTLINEMFRQQLQISQSQLDYSPEFEGIGGANVNVALLEGATMKLKINGFTSEFQQDIYVAEGRRNNLLGLDFFETNRLNLNVLFSEDRIEENDENITAYIGN